MVKNQKRIGGAFGGNRGVSLVPSEKGVFPLDHMHLCDQAKREYLNCLKTSGHQSEKCRHFSKLYLDCRMEKEAATTEVDTGIEGILNQLEKQRNLTLWFVLRDKEDSIGLANNDNKHDQCHDTSNYVLLRKIWRMPMVAAFNINWKLLHLFNCCWNGSWNISWNSEEACPFLLVPTLG